MYFVFIYNYMICEGKQNCCLSGFKYENEYVIEFYQFSCNVSYLQFLNLDFKSFFLCVKNKEMNKGKIFFF